MDGWRDGLAKDIEALLVLCKLFNILDVGVVELGLLLLIEQTRHAGRDDLGPENTGDHTVNALAGRCTVDSSHLNTIARLQFLN